MGQLVWQGLAALVAIKHVAAAYFAHAEAVERHQYQCASADKHARRSLHAARRDVIFIQFEKPDLEFAIGFVAAI